MPITTSRKPALPWHSASTTPPDNDRVVILVEFECGKQLCGTAMYRNGHWYGHLTGDCLTDLHPLSDKAIWTETPY